jgi:arsenate reductase
VLRARAGRDDRVLHACNGCRHRLLRAGRAGRPQGALLLTPDGVRVADRRCNVLFLCTGNTARSILAESALRHEGGGRFNAFSAGSHPKGVVNPHALAYLRANRLPTEGLRSKRWDEFAGPDAPPLDVVITVCDNAAGEACPVWPGQPVTAHWGVPDPAAATGSDEEIDRAFADAARTLIHRVRLLVRLPVATLDRPSLQQQVRAIGAETPPTE